MTTLDELNSAVATATSKPKSEASKAVAAVLHAIQDALSKDEKVSIAGFGVFEVAARPEREGRNPQTGKTIKIAASKAVKFKPGKGLRDAVNG
ncbi:MAG: HU family DNA-binding protein [Geminicoccaceae bacterium]|jgi:DNA-binding protein HU-beta